MDANEGGTANVEAKIPAHTHAPTYAYMAYTHTPTHTCMACTHAPTYTYMQRHIHHAPTCTCIYNTWWARSQTYRWLLTGSNAMAEGWLRGSTEACPGQRIRSVTCSNVRTEPAIHFHTGYPSPAIAPGHN